MDLDVTGEIWHWRGPAPYYFVTVPADTRILQQRWDSVIWTRAALQTVALAGLLTILVTR